MLTHAGVNVIDHRCELPPLVSAAVGALLEPTIDHDGATHARDTET
jgi:hypothetical protein